MPTIKEYQKQRMLLRKSDPARAAVLGLIIDTAQKTAKTEGREIREEDFTAAVKRQIKAMEKTVELVKENGGETAEQEDEILLLREYLPPMMSEEELTRHIDGILASMPEAERIKKNQGRIMGELKQLGETVDMGLAARLLAGRLS